MAKYNLGTLIRFNATFKDANGNPADPGTVKFITHCLAPLGTTKEYVYPADITKETTGVYHCDIVPEQTGDYRYKWTSSGGVTVVGIGSFTVNADI